MESDLIDSDKLCVYNVTLGETTEKLYRDIDSNTSQTNENGNLKMCSRNPEAGKNKETENKTEKTNP